MGWPVVIAQSGGIPVTDNTAAGFGTPLDIAANGYGTAVTFAPSGGLPVTGWSPLSLGSALVGWYDAGTGAMAPAPANDFAGANNGVILARQGNNNSFTGFRDGDLGIIAGYNAVPYRLGATHDGTTFKSHLNNQFGDVFTGQATTISANLNALIVNVL